MLRICWDTLVRFLIAFLPRDLRMRIADDDPAYALASGLVQFVLCAALFFGLYV